jgi:hypothetical protein
VWLYSRKPVDPENTANMRKVAESLGLDTSNLKPVTQVGVPRGGGRVPGEILGRDGKSAHYQLLKLRAMLPAAYSVFKEVGTYRRP